MDAFEVSVCVIALVCVCVRIIPVVSYRGEEVSVDAFEVSVYVKASISVCVCAYHTRVRRLAWMPLRFLCM